MQLNSLVDPLLAASPNALVWAGSNGSTPQPYGFDQVSALYGYYRVHGVQVEIIHNPCISRDAGAVTSNVCGYARMFCRGVAPAANAPLVVATVVAGHDVDGDHMETVFSYPHAQLMGGNGTAIANPKTVNAGYSNVVQSFITPKPKYFKKYFSMAKLLGMSRAEYSARGDTAAAVTAAPTLSAGIELGFHGVPQATLAAFVQINLRYYIEFFGTTGFGIS